MKIYIAHTKMFDYINELYKPIRNDPSLNENEIILPHEFNDKSTNTRNFYKNIDLYIAECSYSSTGLGIELGWAYDDNKPIYCIHKKDTKIKRSIFAITQNIYEYSNKDEMLSIIINIINNEKAKN